MRTDEFNDLIRQARERMLHLTVQKGHEYTQGSDDRLANFKGIADKLKISPMAVWLVYFHKHFDSVVTYIRDGKEKSSEPVEGRIDDMQVYLDLLRGLVWEHKQDIFNHTQTQKLTGFCGHLNIPNPKIEDLKNDGVALTGRIPKKNYTVMPGQAPCDCNGDFPGHPISMHGYQESK